MFKKDIFEKKKEYVSRLLNAQIIAKSNHIFVLTNFASTTSFTWFLKPGLVAIASSQSRPRSRSSPAIRSLIITSGSIQERQSFGRKKTWLLSYMHYDVWWLYHFRRENSFRTFYRRFSRFIFGTRNNSVRWLLIFGCAQDDTQRVGQEGVCACKRVPRPWSRRSPSFSKPTVYAYDAYLRLIAAKSEKFRFLADTKKKKQLLKYKRRARGRTACDARILARAQNHTTDSAQQGDKHRSRCSTPTHTRTSTHIHVHARTYTNAWHTWNIHVHNMHTDTRSFGQNLKDTSRKKVQVYHVAP